LTVARARLLLAGLILVSAGGLLTAPAQAAPRPVTLEVVRLQSAPAAVVPPVAAPQLPCLPIANCDPAAALAGDAARSAARASLDALSGWVSDGAVAVLGKVGDEIAGTTRPNLDASWFKAHVQVMQTLAVLVVLPLLMASMLSAIVHQDPGRLVRAVAVHLPLALLGGFVAVQLTATALSLTDELSRLVSVGMGNDVGGSIANIGLALRAVSGATVNPVTGGFLGFVIALLVAVGALLVWLELLVRSAAIYVAVMFLPLTLSGLVWPVTARWAKRLIEILVALILSKFVVVAVISLASGAIASDPKDGLSSGLGGAALLLLAGFAPFALLRLVPLVEASVVGHLEGTSRRPVAAGMTSTQTVQRMVRNATAGAGAGPIAMAAAPAVDAAAAVVAMPARGDPGLMAGFPSSGQAPADRSRGGAGGGAGGDPISSSGSHSTAASGDAAGPLVSSAAGVEREGRHGQGE
jgi:type IV secretion system protein TrbL